ncbi:MAG: hypothetical protein JKY55_03795 [Aliivibrio sp.]|uniref:glycosyl hydrolase 2 galactose-binding domain-containing protein n=1 Tax=Aliivibrio sp. TaxID=1872443 RepID=UPI001A3E736F|nr:hypothetical protein [Aliivibrio sp.]
MLTALSGIWQLSPLTDLTLPQGDLTFPAAISTILPMELTENEIAAQEWHLMHDFDVSEAMFAYAAIDIVLKGVSHYAEVRINGNAVLDCFDSEVTYQKEIKAHLHVGFNRIEILFLEQGDDWLLDDERAKYSIANRPMGIFGDLGLRGIRHLRLKSATAIPIIQHGSGEVKIAIYFDTLVVGMIAAKVKFDGMSYSIPIDVRADRVTALFQVDAPRFWSEERQDENDIYKIEIELEGQVMLIPYKIVEGQTEESFYY